MCISQEKEAGQLWYAAPFFFSSAAGSAQKRCGGGTGRLVEQKRLCYNVQKNMDKERIIIMDLLYRSTRNNEETAKASEAILRGLAGEGGLYVPEKIPALDRSMEELSRMNYQEVAYEVMKLFLTDFTEEELKNCIDSAYDKKFDTPEIARIVKKDGVYFLELFHGATIAFKDMALSILPYLLTTSAKKNNVKNEIVILTATSGDTGKAALAGFADVPGTKIIVFYPKHGVSPIQEKQMVTQRGANSINIGRFVPQVVYYVYSYAKLLAKGEIRDGEKINVVVPTGNFGNILAAYYAKQMGVPIAKLICASNENKVLFDFFRTGCYDKNREFILTSSPSMDILISSNLERLIYQTAGRDAEKNSAYMKALNETGRYEITDEMREQMKDFYGNYASEEETAAAIRAMYEKTGYIMDTHTAVAESVYEKYTAETKDETKTIIASTASPYKFTRSVMNAIDASYDSQSDFALVDELARLSGVPVPQAIEDIRSAPVLHDTVCEKEDMCKEVKRILGIR